MARLIPIDDPDDPRVAAYRQVRERDLVGRRGGFIAEGEVVLRVLLTGGGPHRAGSLLVDGKRLAKLSSLIESLPDAIPVYVAGQGMLDEIAGFNIHRGILAHGLRAPDPGATALLAGLGERALVLVLHGIANHDNMGGLFRNGAAFGVDAVLLDATSCDPLYRKAIRVSVGAALKVPFARLAPGEDILALLEAAGVEALALSPGGAEPLAGLVRPPRAALLLGAEGPGLPPDLLARVRTFRIPMASGWDSLNVSSAAAVALHELMCGAGASRSP
ncbi:MAG TPA: RNA methyltransferase [Caulobacteraceae bacterium]|nr:RNA methyltransferase [Caulobacteraceae bacterium]